MNVNKYKILQVLNHNVVLLKDENNIELLASGKGIGFKVKSGDLISGDNINKLYKIDNYQNRKDYQELVKNSKDNILSITEEVISKMEKEFGNNYNERLHISLLDHLNFAIKRYKENIIIGNIFLEEVEFMYPKEYKFAKEALEYINSSLNIDLPKSEIGYICMHIHSAINHVDLGISTMIINIIKDTINFLENEIEIEFKSYHLKQRLITHLKFALKRYFDNIHIENPMGDFIFKQYKYAYEVSLKISDYLYQAYDIKFEKDELAYLTIHLQNIILFK